MSKTKKYPVNMNLCGGELQNWRFQSLTTAPTTYVEAMPYYDSVNHIPKYHNGTELVEFGRIYTQGTGIVISAQNIISVNLSASDIPNITLSKISDVTASPSEVNILDGATLSTTELNYVDGVTSPIQTQLDNKITKNTAITGATKCKITYDENGLVTSGGNLIASDIPDLSATYLSTSLKGANGGLAELDSNGKVPSTQLPGYVDDVIETYIVSGATPLSSGWLSLTPGGSALTPETGVLYVIVQSGEYQNREFRWSGTVYAEINKAPGQATESASGIAEIATNGEVEAGTDDTRIVTPLKLSTYYQEKLVSGTNIKTIGGASILGSGDIAIVKKFALNNPALTTSGGGVTWPITNSLGTKDVGVHVYEISTGDEVFPAVNVAQTSPYGITIEMLSSTDVSADTYRAVVMG